MFRIFAEKPLVDFQNGYILYKNTEDSCKVQAFPLLFLSVVTPSKVCLKIKPKIMYQDIDLEVADGVIVQLKKKKVRRNLKIVWFRHCLRPAHEPASLTT